MSSSFGQNPTFFCQQLAIKYCHGWLKSGWEITWYWNSIIPPPSYKDWQIVLVTLYHGFILILSKTIGIGDTNYHIQCTSLSFYIAPSVAWSCHPHIVESFCPFSIFEFFSMWEHGEVTPMSSRTSRVRQKNLLFLSCITKMDQNFINFFSWLDLHNIYYILKIHNQIWSVVFLIKHFVSN